MLILVRHGRTVANAHGLLQGRADRPLDDVGRAQARRLAEVLAPVERVVTSPLARARSTAEAISPHVVDDERWIELDYGELDGQPVAEVADETWARWRSDPDFAPPGGESLTTLDRRVRTACEELAAEAALRDVVVVSHVSPIKAAVAWAVGGDVSLSWRIRLAPASITRIAFDGHRPVLQSFNETLHLAG